MPLQMNIVQPSGATATYHVIMNATANFVLGGTNNASVVINSYLNSSTANDEPLGSMNLDISPIAQNAVTSSPSLLSIIENYLLTTPTFSGGMQVI